MGKSKIEYCDYVYNPIVGCTGAGCVAKCWAWQVVKRMYLSGLEWVRPALNDDLTGWSGKPAENWDIAYPATNKVVFFGSMFDIGGMWWDLPTATQRRIAQHIYGIELLARAVLLLTKHPQNYEAIAQLLYGESTKAQAVWFGTSISTQADAEERVPYLTDIQPRFPWIKAWLSVEPMLEPIDIPAVGVFDQVIVGCESGPGARPMDLDWVRAIRDQCQREGVPFYFKQAIVDGKKQSLPALDGVVHDQLAWRA